MRDVQRLNLEIESNYLSYKLTHFRLCTRVEQNSPLYGSS